MGNAMTTAWDIEHADAAAQWAAIASDRKRGPHHADAKAIRAHMIGLRVEHGGNDTAEEVLTPYALIPKADREKRVGKGRGKTAVITPAKNLIKNAPVKHRAPTVNGKQQETAKA
jgi:hypothetical protein